MADTLLQATADRLRVFISSTIGECATEREAARAAIRGLNFEPVQFEREGARAEAPRDFYLRKLQDSHIVIGIYRKSYGWIDEAKGMLISGLEDEFREAQRLGKDFLAYVLKSTRDRDARLEAMVSEMMAGPNVLYFFDDGEDLEARFRDDLTALITDRVTLAQTSSPSQVEGLVAALLVRIEVAPETLTMEVRPIELRRFLEWDGQGTFVGRPADWPTSNARYVIEVPVSVIAAERWPSFTVQPRDPAVEAKPDKQLKILLRNARAAQALFDAHRDLDLVGLAQRFGRSPGYFSRLIRLNYLAPDIVAAIADGTQPPGLNRKTLASAHIPLDWTVQRRMFGFPEPSRLVTPRNLFGRGMWPSRGDKDLVGGRTADGF